MMSDVSKGGGSSGSRYHRKTAYASCSTDQAKKKKIQRDRLKKLQSTLLEAVRAAQEPGERSSSKSALASLLGSTIAVVKSIKGKEKELAMAKRAENRGSVEASPSPTNAPRKPEAACNHRSALSSSSTIGFLTVKTSDWMVLDSNQAMEHFCLYDITRGYLDHTLTMMTHFTDISTIVNMKEQIKTKGQGCQGMFFYLHMLRLAKCSNTGVLLSKFCKVKIEIVYVSQERDFCTFSVLFMPKDLKPLSVDKRFLAGWLKIAKEKDGIVSLATGQSTMNLLDLRAWCQTRGVHVKQEQASAKKDFRRQQSLLSSLVNPATIYSAASEMMLGTLKVNMEVGCDSNMVPCVKMSSKLTVSSIIAPWSVFEYFKMNGEPVVAGKMVQGVGQMFLMASILLPDDCGITGPIDSAADSFDLLVMKIDDEKHKSSTAPPQWEVQAQRHNFRTRGGSPQLHVTCMDAAPQPTTISVLCTRSPRRFPTWQSTRGRKMPLSPSPSP